MECIILHLIFCLTFLCKISLQQNYVIPEATVELLNPRGFSVSIPDTTGISLFAFHGKLNEEFNRREGGYYSKDITLSKNQKWTYTDRSTNFKIGDTIHYWLYIDYFDGRNNLGYESDYRTFTVRECPGEMVDAKGTCNAPDPRQYQIPDASVEILQPTGFSISIPDQEGIQLFAFHGKVNEEFNGRESGRFSKDITSPRNGKWAFVDRNTKLKPGDILYYWLYVIRKYDGIETSYVKEHQKHVVTGPQKPPQERCLKSLTTSNGRDTCADQLLLDEEFDSLNPNNWTREIRYADDPDYEFVIYDKFEENLHVKSSELHIKPTLTDEKYGERFIYQPEGYDVGDSCTGRADTSTDCRRTPAGGYALPPVFSARINSTVSFTYGRVDIRAKLPKGDWIYPQLFLTPKHYEYGTNDYDSGEIRIAFVNGNTNLNRELQGMILLGTSTTAREFNIRRLRNLNEGWSDHYHIFSVIWKPDLLAFLVDNKEYGSIKPPPGGFSNAFTREKPSTADRWKSGGNMAPFDKEMFLKIGVGVGGHSFPETPGKPYTNTEAKAQAKFYKAKNIWKRTWTQDSELTVDYVKVYAL